jgi:hypothetical protein
MSQNCHACQLSQSTKFPTHMPPKNSNGLVRERIQRFETSVLKPIVHPIYYRHPQPPVNYWFLTCILLILLYYWTVDLHQLYCQVTPRYLSVGHCTLTLWDQLRSSIKSFWYLGIESTLSLKVHLFMIPI